MLIRNYEIKKQTNYSTTYNDGRKVLVLINERVLDNFQDLMNNFSLLGEEGGGVVGFDFLTASLFLF